MRSFSSDRIDLVQQIWLDLDRSDCLIQNAFIVCCVIVCRVYLASYVSVQPGKTLPQGATILKLVTSQAGAAAAAGKPATVLGAGSAAVAASPSTPQQLQARVGL